MKFSCRNTNIDFLKNLCFGMLHSFIHARKLVFSIFKRHCIIVSNMSSEVSTELIKRKGENLSDEENVASKKVKTNEEEAIDPLVENILKNSNRIRKPKKAVLLLSYLGKEFFGMQRNANVSTVEEVLLKALLEAEIILKGEFDFPKTMKFQRAARTDKGVSAVRQIVSLKIPMKEICSSLPEKVNKYLPPEVRVIAVKRVTQSFDAKIACDARTYSYMLPTFAFSPTSDNDELYRITAERIGEVNKFLQNYTGTKNFYNFTSGRLPGDPSCKRYILACECGSPFLSNDVEFSVIKVKGQSFMLHQIRKMVGLAIAFMRNLADENVLKKAWLNERIDIPKAPGLGLMLEELHYDWYNTKYGADGTHEALQWDEYDEIVNEFKREKICANIAKTEREEKSMMQWLETLPHHSYDVRDAGPPTMLPSKEVSKPNENKISGDSVLCTDAGSADKVHENSSESCNSSVNDTSVVNDNQIECKS